MGARRLEPISFDSETGEVHPSSETEELREANGLLHQEHENDLRQISRLKRELHDLRAVEPESKDVREVLAYWRGKCMPKARIVAGSERWEKVRARLKDKDAETNALAYTPAVLMEAVDGALLSEFHVRKGHLDAKTIFRDSTTVDQHRGRLLEWKAEVAPILKLPVALQQQADLDWLAEKCQCNHLRIEHSVYRWSGSPMQGWVPCMARGCACVDFDDTYAEDPRYYGSPAWREREERILREAEARHAKEAAA